MTTELTTIEKIDQLTVALGEYKSEDYNLLLPTVNLRFIAPDHRIVINAVQLDPEEDFWEVDVTWNKVNDRWQKKVKGYALSKRGLRRLMHISGASAVDSQIRYDNEGRAHARAAIQMTMPDGLTRQFIGSYTWDTPARIEEAEQRYKDKADKEPDKQTQYRKAFESDRARIIKFATGLAETGAINRALRDALMAKNKYTPEEIRKPFVCLQVIEPRQPEIDFDHPFIRKLMSLALLNGNELPDFTPQPTLHLETRPFVDPMSDAVAAGDIEAPEMNEATEIDASPVIIEEMVIDNDGTERDDDAQPQPAPSVPADPAKWMRNAGTVTAMFEQAQNQFNLTEADVLLALGIEDIREYSGSKAEAWRTLWASAKQPGA